MKWTLVIDGHEFLVEVEDSHSSLAIKDPNEPDGMELHPNLDDLNTMIRILQYARAELIGQQLTDSEFPEEPQPSTVRSGNALEYGDLKVGDKVRFADYEGYLNWYNGLLGGSQPSRIRDIVGTVRQLKEQSGKLEYPKALCVFDSTVSWIPIKFLRFAASDEY